jgi:NAD(P)-dependent dehydrogenase (short-subunit alcohol dehydrogenase family)
MRLKDKICVVTGSSRGMGRTIALEMATEGGDLAVVYVDDDTGVNRADAEAVAAQIKEMGRRAATVQADVADYDQVTALMQRVLAEFGRIDILVNNAGINRDATLKNLDKGAWDAVISVNMNGVYHCTKAVIETMLEAKSGRILNISSIMGQTGGFGISNYAASKAGIVGFSKSIAREVAGQGITVNAIAPGFVDVGMLQSVPDKIKESLLKQIPMHRWGKPEEIAKLAVYLASDDAAYITGQVIHINGGHYM